MEGRAQLMRVSSLFLLVGSRGSQNQTCFYLLSYMAAQETLKGLGGQAQYLMEDCFAFSQAP